MLGTDSQNTRLSRRAILTSALAFALIPWTSRAIALAPDDEAELDRVKQKAKAAGLPELGVDQNDRYIAIGDAPAEFRKECVDVVGGIYADFMKHFKEFKGFDLAAPKEKLIVLVFKDRHAYLKFQGQADDNEKAPGAYDPNSNDLMWFDNRSERDSRGGAIDNALVLTHETTHQLTFNTGLLRRDGDVPKAIAEGLACYAEVRSANVPKADAIRIGAINKRRLLPYLNQYGRNQITPIEVLIRDDTLFDSADPDVQLRTYAESWLLVHFLMTTKSNSKRLIQFKAYLKAIKSRDDNSHRMEDWRAHFGEDATFNRDFQKYLKNLKTE